MKAILFLICIFLICSVLSCKKEDKSPTGLIQGTWTLQKLTWHYYSADNGSLVQADTLTVLPGSTGLIDSYTVQFNKNGTFTELKREVTGSNPNYYYLRDTINGNYSLSATALTLTNNYAGYNYSILTNLGLNFSETPTPYSETITQLTKNSLVLHDEQTAYFFTAEV